MTQRSLAQAFLALQAGLTAFLSAWLWLVHDPNAAAASIGALMYAGCYWAFRRGWEPARQLLVMMLTALLVFGTREPYLTGRLMLGVLIPPIVALMLTSARWIVASTLAGFVGICVRSQFRTPLLEPLDLLLFVMAASGLVVVRRSVDVAMGKLKAQAKAADSARDLAEAAAREAIAARDRATKLEDAVLHLQRLESVGRLAGGVAHDFNNLLTVIGASASMAERAVGMGDSPAADLEEIQLAVGRASELTKQLLAFARKQVLVKRSVDVGDLVNGVERMLSRVIDGDVALITSGCAEPLRVQADPGQLEQVLVNLVLNARDAVSAGGRIELRTQHCQVASSDEQEVEGLAAGDYACIEVRDNGSGMTDDVQRRLFEPFFTTKPAGKGTGLGLATSFGIVRQHEGTIRVESRPGEGTVMRVLLPLAAAIEAPATSGVVKVAGNRPRVLVAEDEPQVRAIATRALTSAGFEVHQAANGALALAALNEQTAPFDVLVTDVVMPELSGPELARAARQRQPRLGVVFMSGFPEAMTGAHTDEFPGAAFLAKPFSPQTLIEAVRERVPEESSRRLQTM
ncbi:MAG TPA: ATP-binding protein [Polyangiaceae bacterium]|nr:ATP-binding protein [Polyangiaceae bacterium]